MPFGTNSYIHMPLPPTFIASPFKVAHLGKKGCFRVYIDPSPPFMSFSKVAYYAHPVHIVLENTIHLLLNSVTKLHVPSWGCSWKQ